MVSSFIPPFPPVPLSQVRVWNCGESAGCLAVGTGHVAAVSAVALSRRIQSGGFRSGPGEGAHTLGLPSVEAGGLSVDPAPRPPTGKPAFMASVGADKLLKVWDLAPYIDPPAGTASASAVPLRVTAAVVAHDKDVNSVAVAPNDSLVATGSQDKTAKVWGGGKCGYPHLGAQ